MLAIDKPHAGGVFYYHHMYNTATDTHTHVARFNPSAGSRIRRILLVALASAAIISGGGFYVWSRQMVVVGHAKNAYTGQAVGKPDVTISSLYWVRHCESSSDGRFVCRASVTAGEWIVIWVHQKGKPAYARYIIGQPGKRVEISDILVL